MRQATLILIDIQEGFKQIDFFGTERNNLDAEIKASELLAFWRKNHFPVIHIQHSSQNPDSPLFKGSRGYEIQSCVKPRDNEIVIEKSVNSAFIGTNLQQILEKLDVLELVIAGITTDHCVSTTTRMASNLGYSVTLASDATATFNRIGISGEHYSAEEMHRTALASLKDEFAIVKTSHEIITSFLEK